MVVKLGLVYCLKSSCQANVGNCVCNYASARQDSFALLMAKKFKSRTTSQERRHRKTPGSCAHGDSQCNLDGHLVNCSIKGVHAFPFTFCHAHHEDFGNLITGAAHTLHKNSKPGGHSTRLQFGASQPKHVQRRESRGSLQDCILRYSRMKDRCTPGNICSNV